MAHHPEDLIRISEDAVTFLERKRRRNRIPESYLISICEQAGCGDGPKVRLAMAFVAGPRRCDHEVVRHGTHFCVAPEVLELGEEIIIDLSADRSRRLSLRTRPAVN
jgi:hypothetical protein